MLNKYSKLQEDLNMNHFEFQVQQHQHQQSNCTTATTTPGGDVQQSPTKIIVTAPSSSAYAAAGVSGYAGGRNGISGRIPGAHGRYQPNVKPRRRCLASVCTPSAIFLTATILLTALATFLLSVSLTSRYWEMMTYDPQKTNELLDRNETMADQVTVTWLFQSARVPQIVFNRPRSPPSIVYLLPIHSGVWVSCIDLSEAEYAELVLLGYDKPHCVDHLNPDLAKPTEARASWQHRMQNLAIACALVCLILLGAAVVVGLFGVLRPQISAVLVTGVIYMLAALFSLFTLTIVHFKHKNRKDWEALDVWTRLTSQSSDYEEFHTARHIFHGWSLKVAWGGSFVCLLASVMWVLLSKIMRYNPFS